MQGVGEPQLLVSGGASPHEYSLKPSNTHVLSEAQLVFWIGPDLESFLVKPLNNLANKVRAVALLAAPGMIVLPLREGGAWEPQPHGHEGLGLDPKKETHSEHDRKRAANHDVHVWLDPVNAIAMVRQIVAQLGEVDATHKVNYERNGVALMERLNQLNQQLSTELASVRDRPYIVFHDAYQYFERRYDLSAVGLVVLSPEQRPGAKRVADIRARIRNLHARCVFGEPQFQLALVETLIAGSNARRGVLDPEGGAELIAGPEAYFQLLHGLSSSLHACLSGS
jgi:zinc transport system substrate-binding protein